MHDFTGVIIMAGMLLSFYFSAASSANVQVLVGKPTNIV